MKGFKPFEFHIRLRFTENTLMVIKRLELPWGRKESNEKIFESERLVRKLLT